MLLLFPRSRDSSVGIAPGYGLDDRGTRVRFPAEAGNFSLHHRVQNGSGPTQPPIQWVPGVLSLGVERPEREADHSPPSSTEVQEWVELYLHSPNTSSWRGAHLKHRDNFTFTLLLLLFPNTWIFPRFQRTYSNPSWFPCTFLIEYSKAKLKSNDYNASPCFKSFWMRNESDGFLPMQTLL
jgi:hypothetical protein